MVPAEFEMRTVRPNNNRFFWFKANTLAGIGQTRGLAQPFPVVNVANRAKIISVSVRAGADDHTTIAIRSPVRSNTIWLSPDIIDYDIRLKVKLGSRQLFNDFVEPSVEHILDDLRLRGDRQRVYHTRIDLN